MYDFQLQPAGIEDDLRAFAFNRIGIRAIAMFNELDDVSLLQKAAAGDQLAIAELFRRHRERLNRLVRLRLHRALRGQIDEASVLDEALLEAARRAPHEAPRQGASVFLWLREITAETLTQIHQRRLGGQAPLSETDVSLHHGALPAAHSATLAAQLLGDLAEPSSATCKAEARVLVQQALNSMAPADREALTLRHFEQLTLAEAAEVMGLTTVVVGKSYLRALKRMKSLLLQLPGYEHL